MTREVLLETKKRWYRNKKAFELGVKEKECYACGSTLPFSRYGPDDRRYDGLRGDCRDCHNRKSRDTRRKHLKRMRDYDKKTYYQKNYGISKEEYESMVSERGGKCQICNTIPDKKLRVDHCHSSGKIRDLLCHNCNTALGHVKDNPEIIKSMLAYIERHAS